MQELGVCCYNLQGDFGGMCGLIHTKTARISNANVESSTEDGHKQARESSLLFSEK